MPFAEIGQPIDWVNIHGDIITISKPLKTRFNAEKYKLLYDEENKLFALQKSNAGYRLDKANGRIYCRRIKHIPNGKFNAKIDGDMIVVNLDDPLK